MKLNTNIKILFYPKDKVYKINIVKKNTASQAHQLYFADLLFVAARTSSVVVKEQNNARIRVLYKSRNLLLSFLASPRLLWPSGLPLEYNILNPILQALALTFFA